ncbi:FkbM family methyltransferase [Nisaea denitrificans]|uniref:FkbM family methyltransferase n=1 Tax=Nisaea denitrificans TaxID=390877 RepID=UPI000426916D|nr:FkbM family methyltransferase [Nisaea denitrificans]
MSAICDCTLCRADPAHPAKRFHDMFRRITACMSAADLAASLIQYGQRSEMGDSDDDILRQIGRLDARQLREARMIVQQDQDALMRGLSEAANQIPALAANAETRDWLIAVADAAARQSGDFRLHAQRLVITLNGRLYQIDMPSDWMAYANLFEVFLRLNYAHDPKPVDTIFDVGAFVGLSSIYLNSCYPEANIIAVEPNPANLRAMSETLGLNATQIKHRTIGKVLAAESGTATIASLVDGPDATSMMNSTIITLTNAPTAEVDAIGLEELVGDADRYGLKLDIEGGEFGLKSAQAVLSDAAWILGEFHYGPWSTSEDQWLPKLLARDFELSMQVPRLEMTGRGEFFCIGQDFRAVKPKDERATRSPNSLREQVDERYF